MPMLIAVDNLDRDYQPHQIIEVSEDKDYLLEKADMENSSSGDHASKYYKVVPDNYELNFDSMYDISDTEPPSYKQFCNFTGVNLLGDIKGAELYLKQYTNILKDK